MEPVTWWGNLYISHAFDTLSLSHFELDSSCSHSLLSAVSNPQLQTTWNSLTETQQQNIEELTAIENALALMKLVYLPSFNRLNFPWMLMLPHTYIYILAASQQAHTSLLCTFLFSCVHTHTSTTLWLFHLSCLDD